MKHFEHLYLSLCPNEFVLCSSVVVLNGVFLEAVSQYPDVKVEVVHISSLCGVQPFKTWGLYCSAKAARNMFFKTMAVEEPNIRVLNYAPGPLDNDMQVCTTSMYKLLPVTLVVFQKLHLLACKMIFQS